MGGEDLREASFAERRSLLLGCYDDAGSLAHVGVASSFARAARAALAAELAPIAMGLPGHPWEHGFLTGGGTSMSARLAGAACQ